MTEWKPLVSVIVLTRNEEENVEACVLSLLDQSYRNFEVLVVDAASEDATPEILEELASEAPDRLRLFLSDDVLPIGEARNLGMRQARGDVIAYISADAFAHPDWLREMVFTLADGDVAYGRQEHAPTRITPAAVVRGLRYHHFDQESSLPPEAYASNVNAAIRREVFDHISYPDGAAESALDDVLFTERAKTAGYRVRYNPRMLVYHKDATTLRGELTKNRREGYAWGLLHREVGLHRIVLAWGGLVAGATVALALWPTILTLLLLTGAVYAPAARRGWRAQDDYPWRKKLAGLAVSPAFDLAFLVSYCKGLVAAALPRRGDSGVNA